MLKPKYTDLHKSKAIAFPNELIEKIQNLSQANRRSFSSQVIFMLEQNLNQINNKEEENVLYE